MSEGLIWKSNVTEWDKVSVESYRFIIEQAKERLNEVIEESHTITKKGMTLLLTYLTVLSSLFGYIFSEKFKIPYSIITVLIALILAVFALYVFTLLLALIIPKNLYYKGSPPREIFFKEVFEDLTSDQGLKNLLCNEAERIQDKIERISLLNKKRGGQYKSTLQLSLIFIAIAIFTIVKTICNL
jgi:hypothetical protein